MFAPGITSQFPTDLTPRRHGRTRSPCPIPYHPFMEEPHAYPA